MSLATKIFSLAWTLTQVILIHNEEAVIMLLTIDQYHCFHSYLRSWSKLSTSNSAITWNLLIYCTSIKHGFRKKRSCCSVLLNLTNSLFSAENNGQNSAMAMLDFSRAFDSIDHEILLMKLTNLHCFTICCFIV